MGMEGYSLGLLPCNEKTLPQIKEKAAKAAIRQSYLESYFESVESVF